MADYNLGTARGVIEIEYNGDGATRAQRDMQRTGQSADKINPALDKSGKVAGVAGLAIAGGFALAAKSAADFEQQMSGIAAVSGASDSQLEQLRSKALQLGKDTQYSASESAQAIQELVKAGISVPDVLNGAADSVVALAAAGGVDMPTAATIASNAMNQFGIKAKDMKGVVDDIAGAANASAIDVTDLGQSMQQVGAVANLAGVNFHDTATAIALMGNAGIKGSDAGTSLKTMFQRLQPQTDQQAGTMKELGLLTYNLADANKTLQKEGLGTASNMDQVRAKLSKYVAELGQGNVGTMKNAKAVDQLLMKQGGLNNAFYDAHGNTKSLAEVSGVLQKALKGMTAEQKQAALTTLFGSDAIRGAAVLADNGSKGFNKMAAAMGKVSAADVAAKRMDNFKGSLEQMKGSLETAGIAIGTLMLPALRSLVDSVTSVVNAFLNLPGSAQKVIAILVAVVGVILLVVSAVVKYIKMTAALKLALEGTRLEFIATWAAALGPIALVIAAVLAVVAIIVLLWKHNQTFHDIVVAVWNGVKSAVMAVVNWFKSLPGMFQSVWNAIQSGVAAVVGWIRDHWRLLISIFLGPLGLVIALVTKFWPQIQAIFNAGIAFLLGIWRAFWNTFGGIIKAAWGLVMAIIRLAWVIIRGVFLLELRGILAIARTVWNAIVAVFRTVWNVIKAVVGAAIRLVKAIVTREWNGIKAVTSAVWNAIKAVISAVWSVIGGTVMAAVNRVKSLISGAWNAAKSLTSSAWNGLKNIVSNAVDGIGNLVGTIKDKVLGALSGAASWLYNSGKAIIQGLLDGIESMIGAVTSKITSVTDKISRFLPHSPVEEGPLKVLNRGHAGRSIVQMVIDGIGDMKPQLESTMNTLVSVPSLTSDLARVGHASVTSLAASTPGSTASGTGAGRMGAPSRHRLVEGRLSLDASGRAFISGVAEDVYDGNERFAASYGRMAG